MKIPLITFFLYLSNLVLVMAQDPHRFDEDIKKFNKITAPEDVVVFTGSSSIRFWDDLTEDCSKMEVVNTGFGGSHMSDLLYFIDETILRFKPSKVYIYEGDNDIAGDKRPRRILRTTKKVTRKLLASSPNTEIRYISAKPSPSRWAYKKQYERFNALLNAYCNKHEQLDYIDVWTPMLGNNGRPKPHIFVEDSLHMNRQGYLIWKDMICRDSE
ncbi:MAG: G-D-S-L family lipolytic protein [Bacteroidia bacterium]|nr:G-D-S-L family lipolytic protein [Bacteroidia bacterium]RZV64333.1 MAG: G-D-S-L family lipolytic protein [Flavobacteriaceae bacterium]